MKNIFLAVVGLVGAALIATAPLPAAAAPVDVFNQCKNVGGTNNVCNDTAGKNALFGTNSIFKRIIDILLFLVGAVAVIMIIIGGLRYVLSGGDQAAVKNAKNTILYAVVGLIIAILAFAIVQFVVRGLRL